LIAVYNLFESYANTTKPNIHTHPKVFALGKVGHIVVTPATALPTEAQRQGIVILDFSVKNSR
jgi:hypothetical protein